MSAEQKNNELTPLYDIFHVPCSRVNNIEQATKVFLKLCPDYFYPRSVHIFDDRNPPLCKWMVDYEMKNSVFLREYALPLMYDHLERYKPFNTKILMKGKSSCYNVTVIYGVDVLCNCCVEDFQKVENNIKHEASP